MDKYFDYVKGNIKHGKYGYATNRMPLWIKPDNKIDVLDAMDFMRNHLEGTELDMSKDPGAGPFGCPYRWRPLTWKVDGKKYCNERVTATQQTAFSFVAQCRSWLPNEVGGLFWFGTDDPASTVYFPMYTSATRIPESYKVGNGNIMDFTPKAAHWVFNMVCNLGYTRYNIIHPEIRKRQKALEAKYLAFTKMSDKAAESMLSKNKELAIEYLTDFSCNQGENLVKDWRNFYGYLFAKYVDGNVKTKNPNNMSPKCVQPGYPEEFLRHIIEKTGDKLEVKGASH